MIKVCKTFTFEVAHALMGYEGACANIHGHSYKLEVVVTSGILDGQGMIADFGAIKEMVNAVLDSDYDHQLLLNEKDHRFDGVGNNVNIHYTSGNPTCENMVTDIAEAILEQIKYFKQLGRVQKSLRLYSVKLWETATCYAEYIVE